nr:enoyl-CoA hydratase-related protein [Aquicoccus sp. G2-2]MEA1113236.1 enoyl-CoA hydratase-related protein [Aquicoccus sp. G2-2]
MNSNLTDGVLVLSFAAAEQGRVAVLDAPARAEASAALSAAGEDPAVRAVVIAFDTRGFAGTLPPAEVAGQEAAPTLGALCDLIAGFPKPVVAALRGAVFDAGVALALAARARIAVRGTRLGLRDIRRGLVPGAGITQRLPRLLGADGALNVILSGRMFSADAPQMSGFFQAIVERNVVGEAVQAARALVAQPVPVATPGFADAPGYLAEIARHQAKRQTQAPEARAAVECVEAAQLLPLEAGLALEAALREDLAAGARARGLIRAQALEERAVVAVPGPVPDTVVVLGDGPAAERRVLHLLEAGLSVRLAEQHAGGAERARRWLEQVFGEQVQRGRLPKAAVEAALARFAGGPSDAFLGQGDLVIEACGAPPDALSPLVEVIRQATPDTVPVLLESQMALKAGAHGGLLQDRVLGCAHHLTTGNRRLSELVVSDASAPDAVARAAALLERLERRVLISPPHDGLIAGRLMAALMAVAEWCVAQGASPGAVEAALAWPQGPFHTADADGMAMQVTRMAALGWHAPSGGLFQAFADEGRSGRAAGKGIFTYAAGGGAAAEPDEEGDAIVLGWRGPQEASLSAEEIRRRIWSTLFSEGLMLLQEGRAASADDIDLAALEALGLPRASGGPMKAAEIRGLIAVRRELKAWNAEEPAFWQPSTLLDEMIKNGVRFGA